MYTSYTYLRSHQCTSTCHVVYSSLFLTANFIVVKMRLGVLAHHIDTPRFHRLLAISKASQSILSLEYTSHSTSFDHVSSSCTLRAIGKCYGRLNCFNYSSYIIYINVEDWSLSTWGNGCCCKFRELDEDRSLCGCHLVTQRRAGRAGHAFVCCFELRYEFSQAKPLSPSP